VSALRLLGECEECRRVAAIPFGGLNDPHLRVVNLINNLERFISDVEMNGRPMLTVYYMANPHRFHIFYAQNQVMTVRSDGIFPGQLGGKRNRRNTRKNRKSRNNRKNKRKTTRIN
jgi:hypothetical protein